MKILFIITQSEFGGAQRFISTLINGLSGYDIVVAAGPEGEDKTGLLNFLEKKEINTRRLKYLRRGINPLFDFGLGIWEIYRLIKREKPDTLFLCSSKAGALGSFAARLYRRKTQIDLASQDTQKYADADKEFLYSDITYKIRGACFKVWKQFRGAFKEKAIERALIKELTNQRFKVDSQKQISILYENEKVGTYIPDMIVEDKVLVELKRKPRLTREDEKQFWLYLKGSKYRLGLLINFGRKLEIKRKVYDTARSDSAPISVLPKAQNQRVSAIPKVIYRIGGWAFNDPRPKREKIFYKFIEKFSAYFKDIIIVNSEHDRKQAIELKIKPKSGIITIYNGIDINKLRFLSFEQARDEFSRITRNSSFLINDIIVVGTIANFYPAKGLNFLVESANILIKSYPTLLFVIIGEGQERDKLERLIKKYNLENNFFLLGAMPDAYKYLKAFNIFVLPSVKEGFPWTILEAMAAGVPIVATKVGAVPEIQPGILVEPRNPEQLAKAIEELINNPELRKKLASNAKKLVEQKFVLSKMVKQIEDLF